MADYKDSRDRPIIYTIAKWWLIGFGSIAVFAMIAGVTGMLLMPGAQPDPDTYPARFAILALAAMAWAIPGWIVTLLGIVRR